MQSLARISSWGAKPIPATKRESWISQSMAMRDFFGSAENYYSKLSEIKHPVLVGGAKQDLAFPMIDSFLLAREIPNAELLIYPNAGHAFHHQYAVRFANAVNDFLNRI